MVALQRGVYLARDSCPQQCEIETKVRLFGSPCADLAVQILSRAVAVVPWKTVNFHLEV